jgi:hypothetical protein
MQPISRRDAAGAAFLGKTLFATDFQHLYRRATCLSTGLSTAAVETAYNLVIFEIIIDKSGGCETSGFWAEVDNLPKRRNYQHFGHRLECLPQWFHPDPGAALFRDIARGESACGNSTLPAYCGHAVDLLPVNRLRAATTRSYPKE